VSGNVLDRMLPRFLFNAAQGTRSEIQSHCDPFRNLARDTATAEAVCTDFNRSCLPGMTLRLTAISVNVTILDSLQSRPNCRLSSPCVESAFRRKAPALTAIRGYPKPQVAAGDGVTAVRIMDESLVNTEGAEIRPTSE
jgi:hypothetical protein